MINGKGMLSFSCKRLLRSTNDKAGSCGKIARQSKIG